PPPPRLNASELIELYTASRLINPRKRAVIQITRSPFSLLKRVDIRELWLVGSGQRSEVAYGTFELGSPLLVVGEAVAAGACRAEQHRIAIDGELAGHEHGGAQVAGVDDLKAIGLHITLRTEEDDGRYALLQQPTHMPFAHVVDGDAVLFSP